MARKTVEKVEAEAKIATVPAAPIAARPKALVFISHDTRDADLAEAFAELLADVSVGTLKSFWPAPGSEDTELGVLMELEVGHGEASVYAGVQA